MTADIPTPSPRLAADGAPACLFGCIDLGEHDRGCACTTTCPDHEGHCRGCAPRPAHEASLMCGRCFYRRLRSPIRQLPAVHAWVGTHLAGLRAATYDRDRIHGGGDEAPLPFNVEVHEWLRVTLLVTRGWADRGIREAPPGPGLREHTVTAACGWLDDHAGWVSEQVWVVELVEHLAELLRRARGIAPWQPTRTHLPLPCTRCDQLTLVLFGGEDWVTCTGAECDNVIGYGRYARLVTSIARRNQEAS